MLVVLGSLALESRLAQEATESTAVLAPVILAFWVAGTIESRTRSAVIGIAGAALGSRSWRRPGPAPRCRRRLPRGLHWRAIRRRCRPALARGGRRDLEQRTADLERGHDEREREAIAEERARIARELHDVVGHSIA